MELDLRSKLCVTRCRKLGGHWQQSSLIILSCLEKRLGFVWRLQEDELCGLKEHIVVKMELVMNKTEKGEAVRMNALKVKEITDNAFRNKENFKGSSVKAMDGFLSAALIMREMK